LLQGHKTKPSKAATLFSELSLASTKNKLLGAAIKFLPYKTGYSAEK
jgi:hypothetical protein